MRKLLLAGLLLLGFGFANAQIRAITDTGEVVLLYSDGTYEFLEGSPYDNDVFIDIKENKTKFTKSGSADFLVKSKKMNIGVYLDPKKWKFQKSEGWDDYEYDFELRNEDLFGGIITEKIPIDLESLAEIAYNNFKEGSKTQIPVIDQIEYRTVNGIELLYMKMTGVIQGMKITYNGYYYSNDSGTLQFVVYTGQNLNDHYKEDIEELLNGLVEI